MAGGLDSLSRVRLDSLPAEELQRLAEPWYGAATDSLAGTGTGSPVPLFEGGEAEGGAAGALRGEAFSEDGVRMIVERWHRARDPFRDVDVSAVFGGESSLSYGAHAGSAGADGAAAAAADALAGGGGAAAMGADAATGGGGVVASILGHGEGADWTLWVGDAVQNLLLAVIVFFYVFCLYRYFDDVKALFGSVFRRSVTPSERIIERRRSEIFYGFLGKLFLVGTCALGVLAAMWAEGAFSAYAMPPYAHVVMPFAAMAAFFAVVAVQYAVLAVAGGVTRSWPTVATLLRIRLIYFVLSTVMVMPLVLVSQLGSEQAGGVWLKAACVAGAVTVALYVRESVTLFISKKISILHWFLYLCTVEIMPFSILWQIVVRMGK